MTLSKVTLFLCFETRSTVIISCCIDSSNGGSLLGGEKSVVFRFSSCSLGELQGITSSLHSPLGLHSMALHWTLVSGCAPCPLLITCCASSFFPPNHSHASSFYLIGTSLCHWLLSTKILRPLLS